MKSSLKTWLDRSFLGSSKGREAPWVLLLVAFWLWLIAASLLLSGSGFLHPESYSFLPHYLSGRPFWTLIYDNNVTDWGNYQARELSFGFDWMDCQFISWCVHRGHPHFFSVSHFILLLGAGLALWRIATIHLQLPCAAGFALVVLLWTSPSAMLYNTFYRSAKAGLLCALLLAALCWFRAAREPAKPAPFRVALFAVSLTLLPMFDKQGLLFLLAFVVWLTRNALAHQTPRNRRLLLASAAALAFAWCYQRFLGPALTAHLLGYEVARGYASIPFAKLAASPGFLAQVFGRAVLFMLDSFRVPLGNLSAGVALAALIWMGFQFNGNGPRSPQRWLAPVWLLPATILFITGLFAAMLMLFPAMFSNEHRRFFYPLPAGGLWLVLTAAACAAWLRERPAHAARVSAILGLLVLSNLFALQEHRFFLRNGKYQPYFANAARLREALQPAQLLNPAVAPADAAHLVTAAPYFRDAVPPSLEQDRIYLLFLSQTAR